MDIQEFLEQYRTGPEHRPDWAGKISFELELLIAVITQAGHMLYVPMGDVLIKAIWSAHPDLQDRFGPEFSNMQVEINTGPHDEVERAVDTLFDLHRKAEAIAAEFGMTLVAKGYVPQGAASYAISPLVPRYAEFALLPENRQRCIAMCHVLATQVQVGCEDLDVRLAVYNDMVAVLPEFVKKGLVHPDRRQAFDEHIYPGWFPPKFASMQLFGGYMERRGLLETPKLMYGGVRIHPRYSTTELAVGDSTLDRPKLIYMGQTAKDIWLSNRRPVMAATG